MKNLSEEDLCMLSEQLVGQMLGKYQIQNLLGETSFNSVYEAVHVDLGRSVVIKVLSSSIVSSYGQGLVQMLFSNMQTASQMHHNNLVQTYESGLLGELFYVVVQYVSGNNLAQLLKQAGSVILGDALFVIKEVSKALHTGHEYGILHMDVKPANIFLTEDEEVKLSEFGMAMPIEGATSTIGNKVLFGTPWYISPEQIRGDVPLDARSDLYSLGATLFHMLAGVPPYDGDSIAQILEQHVSAPVPSIKTYKPNMPDSVDNLLLSLDRKSVV